MHRPQQQLRSRQLLLILLMLLLRGSQQHKQQRLRLSLGCVCLEIPGCSGLTQEQQQRLEQCALANSTWLGRWWCFQTVMRIALKAIASLKMAMKKMVLIAVLRR
jgi:hypothetical protein